MYIYIYILFWKSWLWRFMESWLGCCKSKMVMKIVGVFEVSLYVPKTVFYLTSLKQIQVMTILPAQRRYSGGEIWWECNSDGDSEGAIWLNSRDFTTRLQRKWCLLKGTIPMLLVILHRIAIERRDCVHTDGLHVAAGDVLLFFVGMVVDIMWSWM